MNFSHAVVAASLALTLPLSVTGAQQFNSDNYLAMPRGMSTTTVTAGTEYSGFLVSFALASNWEFFTGAFLSWESLENESTASWSGILFGKYMLYENAAKNGGFAVSLGTGNYPGHLQAGRVTESLRSFFLTPQLTVPLFRGAFSWDLNAGVQLNTQYGEDEEAQWTVPYSTRLAVYGVIPESAVVGEVYGTSGERNAQYRIGVRWEGAASVIVPAVSWSQGFDGSASGGFEVGFTMFTPRFLCRGGCDNGSE
jgi:hypothetical protein